MGKKHVKQYIRVVNLIVFFAILFLSFSYTKAQDVDSVPTESDSRMRLMLYGYSGVSVISLIEYYNYLSLPGGGGLGCKINENFSVTMAIEYMETYPEGVNSQFFDGTDMSIDYGDDKGRATYYSVLVSGRYYIPLQKILKIEFFTPYINVGIGATQYQSPQIIVKTEKTTSVINAKSGVTFGPILGIGLQFNIYKDIFQLFGEYNTQYNTFNKLENQRYRTTSKISRFIVGLSFTI